VIKLFHPGPALLIQCRFLHFPAPLAATYTVYANAITAQEVAAAEMN
jgi:hypothetical protein